MRKLIYQSPAQSCRSAEGRERGKLGMRRISSSTGFQLSGHSPYSNLDDNIRSKGPRLNLTRMSFEEAKNHPFYSGLNHLQMDFIPSHMTGMSDHGLSMGQAQ